MGRGEPFGSRCGSLRRHLLDGLTGYRTEKLAAGMVAHAFFNASLFLLILVPAFR